MSPFITASGCRANSHRQVARHGLLVLTVACSHDGRRRVHIEKVVYDVKEAFQAAVLEVVADGNELGGDTGSDTNRVLDVKALTVTSVNNPTSSYSSGHSQPQDQPRRRFGGSYHHRASRA